MPRRASASSLIVDRLRNQRLVASACKTPEAVVAHLGAVQSQDYTGAAWAVGQRAPGLTAADVEAAFTAGRVLRTHVLRPTWHFVAPADIRWMLALTAPQVHARLRTYDQSLELDTKVYSKARVVMERALEGGQFLTRIELGAALRRARIVAAGQRLAHLAMHAELEGSICSGPRRGKQFTYALLAERAPKARTLAREAALAELARRYFASHGPATLRDFVWWSGLRVKDAAAGVALGKVDALKTPPEACTAPGANYLFSNYDEYPDCLPRPRCGARSRAGAEHGLHAGVSAPARPGRAGGWQLAPRDGGHEGDRDREGAQPIEQTARGGAGAPGRGARAIFWAFVPAGPGGRGIRSPSRHTFEEASMSSPATVANQKQILANQKRILANQKRIEANQSKLGMLLKNQKKLDQILANQRAILAKLG